MIIRITLRVMKSSFYRYHRHRYHSEELRRERNEVRRDAYFVKWLVVFYSLLCVMDKTLSLTRDARKMKCRCPLLSLSPFLYIYIYIYLSVREVPLFAVFTSHRFASLSSFFVFHLCSTAPSLLFRRRLSPPLCLRFSCTILSIIVHDQYHIIP